MGGVVFILLCVLGGFIYPPLFFLAFIGVWVAITSKGEVQHVPRGIGHWDVTAEHPEWKSYFLKRCESPAETAFLEVMIEQYSLRPEKGILQGGGLALKLQVEMKPYRVDFLANDWLVIEIDGAAYHSSPEAVKRDRIRDEYLQADDYTVLRIPAKTVFAFPRVAVSMVRASIEAGRNPMRKSATPAKKPSYSQLLASIKNTASNFEAMMSEAAAVQKSTIETERAIYTEKIVIERAMSHAKSTIREDEFRAKSPEHAKSYDEAKKRYKKLLEDGRPEASLSTDASQSPAISIPCIEVPPPHSDGLIDEAIKHAHARLVRDRSEYLQTIRQRLQSDGRMAERVKTSLHDSGYASVWAIIMDEGDILGPSV